MDDLLAFLDGPEMEENDNFICVVVHNIDGPGLRDPETQQYLAQLASCSHMRVVASIDHVNAPLCKSTLVSIVNQYIGLLARLSVLSVDINSY